MSYNNTLNIIYSFAFSLAVVMTLAKQMDKIAIFVVFLLAFLFYLVISNISGQNLAGSLPPATYPIPPHLGLDGVDLVNHYPNNVDYDV